MVLPRIYGKIDCLSEALTGVQTVDLIRTSQEVYVGLFKFLELLEIEGKIELQTYYSGSGGTGTGKDYWDTINMAGSNSFSLWKIKATPYRNWDWYLYIHGMNGTQSLISTTNITPSRVQSGTTFGDETIMLGIQAAFSISGSSSTNPWNGSFNLSGAAYKSSPVWTSSSITNSVHVFPRINNLSGTYATSKELMSSCLHSRFFKTGTGVKGNARMRYHYLFDGDGFLFAFDHTIDNVALTKRYYVSYVGPYDLMSSIVQVNSGSNTLLGGTSSLGFIMLTPADLTSNNYFSAPTTQTMYEYTSYGTTTASTTNPDGGIFATSPIGVRNCILSNDSAFHTTTYSPNPFAANSYDERVFTVLASEGLYSGLAGVLTTPLIRSIVGAPASHDTSTDGLRAVLAANAVATNRKITIPWSGSAPGTNLTRQGVTFSIPNYTW